MLKEIHYHVIDDITIKDILWSYDQLKLYNSSQEMVTITLKWIFKYLLLRLGHEYKLNEHTFLIDYWENYVKSIIDI